MHQYNHLITDVTEPHDSLCSFAQTSETIL